MIIVFLAFLGIILITPSIATCSSPSPVERAFRLDGGNSFNTGDNVTYNCRPGSTASGSISRTCLADGTWTNPSGVCQPKSCNVPPFISNGERVYTTRTFSSTVTYTCFTGYNIFPNVSIYSCTFIGSSKIGWNFENRRSPECQIVSCPSPISPENGKVEDYGAQPEYGSVVEYSCNNGYVLSNSALKLGTCNENGNWGVVPTCIDPAAIAPLQTTGPAITAPPQTTEKQGNLSVKSANINEPTVVQVQTDLPSTTTSSSSSNSVFVSENTEVSATEKFNGTEMSTFIDTSTKLLISDFTLEDAEMSTIIGNGTKLVMSGRAMTPTVGGEQETTKSGGNHGSATTSSLVLIVGLLFLKVFL